MVGGAATVALVEAAAVAKLLPAGDGDRALRGAGAQQAGRGRRHRGALVLGIRHAAARLPQLRAHHPTAQPGGAPQLRTPPVLVEAAAVAKLLVAEQRARRQAAAGATGEHWSFAYAMLRRLSRSFALIIRQLDPAELRNAVCVLYLVLRALDTVEDDTSIPTEVKVTILQEFHRHIYNRDWHFSCGKRDHKVLMDKFHYISTAFLELDPGYQTAIEETTRRMGAGMANFACKEIETIEDYDEYCHYAAGLVGSGLSRLFSFIGLENLAPDSTYNSTGLFLQKINVIQDYLEDTNEVPKPRMFWPREIWIKYIDKLEDFKYEENSGKAVQCLNEMITNGLTHAEDCLRCLSSLKDVSILHSCAIPLVMAIAMYAHCYNNVNIFRGAAKVRRGLVARIIVETNSMADVFTAFYNFSLLIESKIDSNDPNAMLTQKHVNAIKETCQSSGLLKGGREFDLDMAKCNYGMVMMLLLLWVAVFYKHVYVK